MALFSVNPACGARLTLSDLGRCLERDKKEYEKIARDLLDQSKGLPTPCHVSSSDQKWVLGMRWKVGLRFHQVLAKNGAWRSELIGEGEREQQRRSCGLDGGAPSPASHLHQHPKRVLEGA